MVRVLVDLAADVLELVAALGVPRPLGVGRVALAAGHLDDDAEVSNRKSTRANVRPSRRWTTCGVGRGRPAARISVEEPPLEQRVAAGVDAATVEPSGTPSAGAAQLAEAASEHERRAGPRSHGASRSPPPGAPSGCALGPGR